MTDFYYEVKLRASNYYYGEAMEKREIKVIYVGRVEPVTGHHRTECDAYDIAAEYLKNLGYKKIRLVEVTYNAPIKIIY